MPIKDPEKRRAVARAWYQANREKCIERSRRTQSVKRWRANRKAAGLKASGSMWDRLGEYVDRAAKQGKEYWPKGCRISPAAPEKKAPTVFPWTGLPKAEQFRVRYRLDPNFREYQRRRISERRHTKPAYAAQWQKSGTRWARAAESCDGSVDGPFIRALLQETHCAYCGCQTKRKHRQVEHVMPLAKGGTHTADNIVMSCSRCNSAKGAKLPLQWLLSKDFGSLGRASVAGNSDPDVFLALGAL